MAANAVRCVVVNETVCKYVQGNWSECLPARQKWLRFEETRHSKKGITYA